MKLFDWIRSLFRRKPAPPPVAFVWLLAEPRALDAATVRRIAEQALQTSFPAEADDDAERFVVGEAPSFVVRHDEHLLLVNCFPVPYLTDPKGAAASIGEVRLRKAVLEHRAWISADLLGEYEGAALMEGMRQIGRLAAALADERCLALYVPHLDQMIPYDPDLLEKLRAENPAEALGWGMAPVTEIAGDDPDLLAAGEEARRRWPEFVAAFRSPRPGQSDFSVKLPISDGKNTEHIWVAVTSIEGDEILGDLANEPVGLAFMREGDRVRGRLADVEDWGYLDGEQLVGGFSVEVLARKQRG